MVLRWTSPRVFTNKPFYASGEFLLLKLFSNTRLRATAGLQLDCKLEALLLEQREVVSGSSMKAKQNFVPDQHGTTVDPEIEQVF